MSKYLYKYVEYNCITDKPYVKYLSVNTLLDIESVMLKIRGLDPEKNRLFITPDMDNKNKWYFTWETDFPFGVKNVNVRPGYIEKIDSDKVIGDTDILFTDFDVVTNVFKNVDKIVLDMDLIAKNTIYQKTRGYYK